MKGRGERKGVSTKYRTLLVAYKSIDENVKDMITKYSVYHIDEEEDLLLLNKHVSSGRNFSFNERIYFYLKSFKEDILKKLEEGYNLDIIELPKSYGTSRRTMLEEFDVQFGDDIFVVDEIEI